MWLTHDRAAFHIHASIPANSNHKVQHGPQCQPMYAVCWFLQGSGPTHEEEVQEERYPSAVPFLPPLSASTVKYYYQFYAFAVGTIILFGGLLSPALEVNLGLGGTLCCILPALHALLQLALAT